MSSTRASAHAAHVHDANSEIAEQLIGEAKQNSELLNRAANAALETAKLARDTQRALAAAEATIARIEAAHVNIGGSCTSCYDRSGLWEKYPCPVRRTLDGTGALIDD